MDSSIELRSKKELIERFIDTLNVNSDIDKEWREFTNKSKAEELDIIIKDEQLKPEKTKIFIANAFQFRELKSIGTEFADILPPIPMFQSENYLAKKKAKVFEKLALYVEKYQDV